MTKVLVIEDDSVLNNQLVELINNQGYTAISCCDGEDGLICASSVDPDLIILDVMLPKRDGFSLLNILRKTSQTPVIMLTAKGAEEERIRGFNQGADDYLAKPFSTSELLLRIKALLRRSGAEAVSENQHTLKFDGLFLDRREHVATIKNQKLELTPTQFRLLWTLLINRGEVLDKAYLHQVVLRRSLGSYDRSLDMHLSRIRRKLRSLDWPEDRIQTVHGKGYCVL